MRVPQRDRQRGLRFHITPLIDVVFLLVIFFLVATHFVQHDVAEAVELPSAATADDSTDNPRRLVVTITADQKLLIKGQSVTLEDIEQMIASDSRVRSADYELRIRADQHVPYRVVEPVMLAAVRAGVTRIAFAVLEK